MDTKPRLNLLRAKRKRSALSQHEVAFLLGAKSGAKISRYENMSREPELKTALAFEAIFDCPIAHLFPDLFREVEAAVRKRAKILARRALAASSRSLKIRKKESISGIASRQKIK